MSEIERWFEQLENGDAVVRAKAAEAICQSGSDVSPYSVALVKATGDEECVAEWAIASLEGLETVPAESVHQLDALLSNENHTIVYWASTLLGRLGNQASACEEHLADLLAESKHDSVRERAAWALGRIGIKSDSTRQKLQAAMNSTNPRLTRLAETALMQANA